MHLPRVLFILKLRQQYGEGYTVLKSSGLLNSATFMKDMLESNNYDTKLVQVVDNNQIDREVTLFKPDIVIVEALWVVPEKFEVLRKRHPKVKWVVRIHSELAFLANEGIALEWINRYVKQDNVFVSANADNIQTDLELYMDAMNGSKYSDKLVFLPNYYPLTTNTRKRPNVTDNIIHVGCFGAIRPLKNHLTQAAAAVQYAESIGKQCFFHINAGRTEGKGDVVLKNLCAFFNGLEGEHKLVEHGWLDREEFLELVRVMDIGLQISFSETFNIVSADFVNEGIPMVTSEEVDWMPLFFTANPTDTKSIARAMNRTLKYHKYLGWYEWQKYALKKYVDRTEQIWLDNICELYYLD